MKRPPIIPITPESIDQAHRARFVVKVDESGECHLWTAARNSAGYSVFRLNGRQVYGHRVAWVIANDVELPTALTIDHLCGVRLCVNPAHLEPVTQRVNNRRQPNAAHKRTHCPAGHPYEGDNLYRFPDGRRACRSCMREAQRRYALRKKASA